MTASYFQSDFGALVPALLLVVGGVGCLLLEVSRPALRRHVGAWAVAWTILSGLALYALGRTAPAAAGDALAAEVGTDLLTLAFAPAFYLATLGTLLLARPYLERAGRQRGEFQALVLFSASGMLLLAQARDLLVLFLALETLSIPLYVLTGFFTDRERSVESALKYFIVGAFSSAFVALGIALTYGAGGTLSLAELRDVLATAITTGGGRAVLAHAGLAFLLVGFGFKVALAPFHAWAPDVYQGAPTPVTVLLGVGSKAAGLAGLVRLLSEVFAGLPAWSSLLAVLAAITLVVGNCAAMLQEDMKRLIAYSGIAHVGFVLMAVVAHGRSGSAAGMGGAALQAVAFYVLAYALMTLGALAVVLSAEREHGQPSMILDYAGLASRRPVLAACMLGFLLSLGGMPPLAGFFGKWLVFQATVASGLGWLAAIAAATSVVAFYAYLRPVVQMYLKPARGQQALEASPAAWMLVAVSLAGTVLLGVLPWLFLDALA